MDEQNKDTLQESLNRFKGILSDAEVQQILDLQNQSLPTGIRINSLKVNPQKTIHELATRYGWEISPIAFCKHAWRIHTSRVSPGTTIEHRMGQYYLQDPASMVPVSLFDFSSSPLEPLILDLAASPGGKTTHLIDRYEDKGFTIANDSSKNRIPALRAVLSNWGGINQIITQYPGENFGNWYPETFDIILLDAPCSMENLRPIPGNPIRETSPTERNRLQERQVQLLKSGFEALKPGGQLVYATCSLAPEEDEAVLDSLLNLFPGSVEIINISSHVKSAAPGLRQFGGTAFHPGVSKALRLWPHLTGMSGFFCALLNKTSPLPILKEIPPARDFSKTQLEDIDPGTKSNILAELTSRYGFNLEEILLDDKLALFSRFDQIFLIPSRYIELFPTLPFDLIGMQLGEWDGATLKPSHEFASRFGGRFVHGKITLSEGKISQWIAGRDIRHLETGLSPQGQYLLVTDHYGRNLGLGKLLPRRLRNLLPRRLI